MDWVILFIILAVVLVAMVIFYRDSKYKIGHGIVGSFERLFGKRYTGGGDHQYVKYYKLQELGICGMLGSPVKFGRDPKENLDGWPMPEDDQAKRLPPHFYVFDRATADKLRGLAAPEKVPIDAEKEAVDILIGIKLPIVSQITPGRWESWAAHTGDLGTTPWQTRLDNARVPLNDNTREFAFDLLYRKNGVLNRRVNNEKFIQQNLGGPGGVFAKMRACNPDVKAVPPVEDPVPQIATKAVIEPPKEEKIVVEDVVVPGEPQQAKQASYTVTKEIMQEETKVMTPVQVKVEDAPPPQPQPVAPAPLPQAPPQPYIPPPAIPDPDADDQIDALAELKNTSHKSRTAEEQKVGTSMGILGKIGTAFFGKTEKMAKDKDSGLSPAQRAAIRDNPE